jgi:uncharacterized membrane protein
MYTNQIKIDELRRKVDLLLEEQQRFSQEIRNLQQELRNLEQGLNVAELVKEPKDKYVAPQSADHWVIEEAASSEDVSIPKPKIKFAESSNFEKILGQNVINILGIAILVLGASIGVKYSIEKDLISPTMRIVFSWRFFVGYFIFIQ